jgi:hypothetical protein
MIRAKKPCSLMWPRLRAAGPSTGRSASRDHGAEFFGGAVDKRLFFFGQLRFRVGQQLVPVRAAAEQLAVPPHGAGIDGFAFGLRHRRQGFLEPVEQRRGEVFAAQVRQQQRRGHHREHDPETSSSQPGAWLKIPIASR